ncbi:MAG: acetolactate synthase large subunit [Lachnospiraceae bacterium]|nr:acetolactate synthase large subunit [Lachnospiraceae bacterium]
MKMNAAEALIKSLENEGVKYIFGIPGEENLAVMQALKNSSIRFITVRHEQGAAFMADMYGRLTGKAGVCLSTLGPGATNLVTGVADANSDGAPLIAITGQVGTERMHLTSHQYLDLVNMFSPITKRSKQIVRPDTVHEIVRIAFKYAENEKPGACHIDLPCDIARQEMPEGPGIQPLRHHVPNMEMACIENIEEAAGIIFQAKKPVILAGHSAIRNKAVGAVTKFAEKLKIPVINTMMAKGVIPYNSPYSLWTIGIPQKDYQDLIFEEADLVIAVGYDIVEFAPRKWNAGENHKILHIDTRPCHINKLYQPDLEVVGDISYSLKQISLRCSRAEEPDWAMKVKEKMVEEYESYENDNAFPMKPQRILSDVRKVMGEDDIVISDVGAHKMWIAREYNCYKPNTCIISNGFATMGIAVPGALSAKLINPDKKILAITGDGGFMMNCQEFETALREKTPFVTLIFNDSSYGLIKWKQEEQYHDSCFVDYTNPDFVKFAESMHAVGYRITRAEELKPVLEEAFKQEVPVIIDCPVDYSENMKLTEHLKKMYKENSKSVRRNKANDR